MTSDILQLQIELMDIEPAIWRRIQMPDDCTFWDLHVAIQNAMGWGDCHLHMFHATDPATGQEILLGLPDETGLLEEEIVPDWERRVTEVLSVKHPRLVYEYDFGDGWEHAVVLEEVLPAVPQAPYPRCIGGARACPPDDVGGVPGYGEFLEALADPGHEEHARYLEWVGGEFDSERFDPHSVEFEDPKLRWNIVFGERVRDEGPPRESRTPVIEGEFTPAECHILLMTPFAPASPLTLNTDHADEVFQQAPLVASTGCYLRLLAEEREPLKLTQRGYLPRRFLDELFEAGALEVPDRWFRSDKPPVKELDSRQATRLHFSGDKAGLTRKQHGKLHLTRRGRRFAEGKETAGALYRHLFEWYVWRFNWAYEDRMPESSLLQAGFWYGLYLLQQYGDEKRPAEFYTDRYLKAFPALVENFEVAWHWTAEESFAHACETRLLSGFAQPFGLAVAEEADDVPMSLAQLVWAGPLLHEVIQWRREEGVSAEGATGAASGIVPGPWRVSGTRNGVDEDGVGTASAAGTVGGVGEEWPETGEPMRDLILDEFLAGQQGLRSPGTLQRYEHALALLQDYLDGREREEWDVGQATARRRGGDPGAFGSQWLSGEIDGFLEFVAGTRTLSTKLKRSVASVCKKLLAWLAEEGYLDGDGASAESVEGNGARSSRWGEGETTEVEDIYDPATAPDADEWLALSDDDRSALVQEYHDAEGEELPNALLHAIFHVVVETQLASADPLQVVETMTRLLRQGLDRHDAIHAIGSVLAETMYSAVREPTDTPDATRAYVEGLIKMTAAKWRSSTE